MRITFGRIVDPMPNRNWNSYRTFGWVGAGILVLLIISGAWYAWLWHYMGDIEDKAEAQHTYYNQTSTDQIPPTPPLADDTKEQKPAQTYQPACSSPRDEKESDLCAQWAMAWAASDTVVWTREQVWATYIEAGLLAGTLILAIIAIGTAFKANSIARDTAERELRAYIALAREGIHFQKNPPVRPNELSRYVIQLDWENCGQTPAYRCITSTNYDALHSDIPDDFAYEDSDKRSGITIGPSQQTYGGIEIAESDMLLASFKKRRLYVWGWVEYSDIFQKRRRRTEVCFEITPNAGLTDFLTKSCGPFNGADEDCHHQPKT